MGEIELSDLAKAYKKAIIIDLDTKTIMVIKEGAIKTYSKEFYSRILKGLDWLDFGDDTK